MAGEMWPFQGLRVLEVATGIAGPMCGKLLLDAGAEVTVLDLGLAETADVSDSWRAFLRDGKRVLGAGDGSIPELLAGVDVLVTTLTHVEAAAHGLDCPTVLGAHPRLLSACVTPYGQSGEYSGMAGDDRTVSALSGLADCTPGFPDRCERYEDPPVQSRAPLAESAGAFVAALALSGAIYARMSGVDGPRHIEVASLEAAASMPVNEWGPTAYTGVAGGRRPGHMANEPNLYLECADGWIILVGFTQPFWNGLVQLMGNPEWVNLPQFADPTTRGQHYGELRERLQAWALTQNGREFTDAAQALGLPMCTGLELAETVASEHVEAVGSVREIGGLPFPADPLVVDGARRSRPPARAAASEPRTDMGAPTASGSGSPHPAGPLAGVRVLDLTQYLAGPYAGQSLARLGAEVILVESATHHPGRDTGPFGGEPHREASMNFNFCNRGKQSVSINLKTAEGRALLTDLIRSSDVVIENFSKRAAQKLGLTYDLLTDIREDIILGSISAFGRNGPWGDYNALHSGVFLMSGLASVTRDSLDRPRMPGGAVPDTMTGTFLALAVVQALAERTRTGRGAQVEIAMLDVALTCMGGLVPGTATPAAGPPANGGFLASAEPARFIAVSGTPEAVAGVGDVAQSHTRREAVAIARDSGLVAAPVLDLAEVMLDPHLHARRFILADTHPVVGARPVPATAWLYDDVRPAVEHAPLLGAHTDEVLLALTDLDAAGIDGLRSRGALT
jgi:crotonobetainyl-CoA:carnitine CoA-transferase CaiB-like acyl-CoA transferase